MAFRARFLPKNPQKYVGDHHNIWARSSWELSVMKWMDSRDAVLRWGSEEVKIPYLNLEDNRIHYYFPDFFMEYLDKDGNLIREIVEVKPRHEADAKYAKHERSKNALMVNEAKWKYAAIWCEERGMKFRVLTEHSIFHQGQPKKKRKKVDA